MTETAQAPTHLPECDSTNQCNPKCPAWGTGVPFGALRQKHEVARVGPAYIKEKALGLTSAIARHRITQAGDNPLKLASTALSQVAAAAFRDCAMALELCSKRDDIQAPLTLKAISEIMEQKAKQMEAPCLEP